MGRPVPAGKITTEWTRDDRSQIATDTVLDGLDIFRNHGLEKGRWTPDGGASLPTYFVGACILAFRPVYLRWFNAQQRGQAELTVPSADEEYADPLASIPDQRATDPCAAVALNDQLQRILLIVTDHQVREGLSLRALGYTQAEAAGYVGLTTKALERRISRTRTRVLNSLRGQTEPGEGGAR